MNTKIYSVLIWKIRERIKEQGPDIDKENIEADTLEEALQNVMRENGIQGPVYAEVLWNNGQDRRKFEDYTM